MIILNEREYAEKCIRDGLCSESPLYVINLLARYYYYCKNLRGNKIKSLLIDYLKEFYPKYIYSKEFWIDSIEKATLKAKKRELYEIDGVEITKKELDTIEEIHDKVLERLAFTILCIAKLNNKKNPNRNGWVNTSDKEVFELARIYREPASNRRVRLGKLYQRGLLELPHKIDSQSYRVNFIDDESDSVLFISDFRELGYEYLKYKGENFIRCKECGILTRGNKNGTKKYCSNCVAYTPLSLKTVKCIDCGNSFDVSGSNKRSTRCPSCYYEHRKLAKRISANNRLGKL